MHLCSLPSPKSPQQDGTPAAHVEICSTSLFYSCLRPTWVLGSLPKALTLKSLSQVYFPVTLRQEPMCAVSCSRTTAALVPTPPPLEECARLPHRHPQAFHEEMPE